MAVPRICSIPDCGKRVFGHGWCEKHYRRWYDHGDVNFTAKVSRNTPEDFHAHAVVQSDGCWNWAGAPDSNGYGWFSIGGRHFKAHRYAFERAKGPIPRGMFVCHSCDNRICVNPDHLWLGTHDDNMRDMLEKGRNNRSKITGEIALAIRSDDRSAKEIATQYGVTKSLVWAIKNRTVWQWL